MVLIKPTSPSFLDLVMHGVGYHHAGVDGSDRKVIEDAFTKGDLPVLCECYIFTMTAAREMASAMTVKLFTLFTEFKHVKKNTTQQIPPAPH